MSQQHLERLMAAILPGLDDVSEKLDRITPFLADIERRVAKLESETTP